MTPGWNLVAIWNMEQVLFFVCYECVFQCARLSILQTLPCDMLGTEQCCGCGCLLLLQVLLTLYPIPARKEWSHYADRMAFSVKTSYIQSPSPLFEFEAVSPCPITADTRSVAEPCSPGRLCANREAALTVCGWVSAAVNRNLYSSFL